MNRLTASQVQLPAGRMGTKQMKTRVIIEYDLLRGWRPRSGPRSRRTAVDHLRNCARLARLRDGQVELVDVPLMATV